MLHKPTTLFLLAFLFLAACTQAPEPQQSEAAATETTTEEAAPALPAVGTIIQTVRLKSTLSEEELLTTARERLPQFEALPGLIQKYYIRLENEGEYMGVYIWESAEAMQGYRESDLAATIAQAYALTEPPQVEVNEIMFQLRE